ncbi:aminotransferase [Microbacterium terricola]|uniref:4-aminobutyrate aminotransferase n=1 Tax=Microbacterium terricola TaxID=344163 RepID=A0ABM8E0B3_9MICO|nr:aminotransferase [Microbacterium terricola]UYK41017.1 aminotransferase [Microbacterium terricola]BDV31226.1 4-aminobutyrate aminotransferase [Microbacterium terricola]
MLFDYFAHVELPTPTLGLDEATALVRSEFGIDAMLTELGSQQDQNFLVHPVGAPEPLGVLKISNPVFTEPEIELQTLAGARVGERQPTVRTPHVVPGAEGWWQTSQGPLHARIISFVSGSTLTGSAYLAPAVVARMGELSARASLALADLDHPAAARTLQWDLRHAGRVIDTLLPLEPDLAVRERVAAVAHAARQALAPVADRLPRQLGHWDITDDNILAPDLPGALPDAIIDFGDVAASWAVGELAVTLSSVLHHDGATPLSTLPAIRAFHELRPLNTDEADALWPLVVLRGAVLVLSGRQQVRLDADNAYATDGLDREYRILEQAAAVPVAVMTRLIRHALGLPIDDSPRWGAAPLLDIDGPTVLLDAGTTAPLNDEGAWLDHDALDRAAQRALDGGAGAVLLPALSPVLTGAPLRTPTAPATIPTAATLWLAHETPLHVPEGATVDRDPTGVTITAGDASVRVTGAFDTDERMLPPRARIDVRLTAAGADVPAWLAPAVLPGWQGLVGDPAAAIGFPAPEQPGPPEAPAAPADADLLARRASVLADVQEHYYARPPRIERGWREHLIDTDGRVYLDMVNNVASVGHAHPRIAEAAGRQLRLLNTNSRFHYAAITEYAERLAATLPDELDTVFLVNSGSEAADLALRLAMAATGRTDIVAMREAYHGWTFASDAVSTSVADNPHALATRPSWVHTVAAANGYRGAHRGVEAARYAPEAVAHLRALAAGGAQIAGFICESWFGNAGGIALPDGYLAEVYAAVRELGGLAIADEVQVGFGRLGDWFWGFEQQGVVPDIVAVAKSIGAGHPLGAVVTTRAIAERYRTQGYFFSSTGGSPVSSVVGTTVLDIIADEALQENARVVGAHLKGRLEALGAQHPLVGTVHGAGLYLGLEFVRDRATLEPATTETAAICDRLLELGVIMQPTGDHQNVLKIKPPLCLTTASADFFVDMLDRVLTTGW